MEAIKNELSLVGAFIYALVYLALWMMSAA